MFKKIGEWFKKLFGKSGDFVTLALKAIELVSPVVLVILEGVDPEAATVLGPIVTKVQTGLATLSAAIEQGEAAPTLAGIAADIKNNLGALLENVGQVKDPATVTKITADVNYILSEIEDIESEFPAATAVGSVATEEPLATVGRSASAE